MQPYPVAEGCCNYDYDDILMSDGVTNGPNSLKLNGPTQTDEFNDVEHIDGELDLSDFRELWNRYLLVQDCFLNAYGASNILYDIAYI